MPANEEKDTSLSFLDVMTNGMGSLLVLFFLMAALQGGDFAAHQAQGFDRGKGQGGAEAEAKRPFVIVVSGQAGAALFAREGGWAIEGDAAFAQEARTSTGANYALLYAEVPPGNECRIGLKGLRPDATGTLTIFQDKALHSRRSIQPVKADPLAIWPVPTEKPNP